MKIINWILAASNILGLAPLEFALKLRYDFDLILCFVMFSSGLHHLVETNQMGHDLEGVYIPILYENGTALRYIDMICAYSMFNYIVYVWGFENIIIFIENNYILVVCSFTSSFICDFIICESPYTYMFFHLIWHSGIYNILYLIFEQMYRESNTPPKVN